VPVIHHGCEGPSAIPISFSLSLSLSLSLFRSRARCSLPSQAAETYVHVGERRGGGAVFKNALSNLADTSVSSFLSLPPSPAPSAGRHGDAAARLGQSDPIDLRPIARTVQLFCNQRFRGRVSFCTHRVGRRSLHASDVNRVRSFVEAHRSV